MIYFLLHSHKRQNSAGEYQDWYNLEYSNRICTYGSISRKNTLGSDVWIALRALSLPLVLTNSESICMVAAYHVKLTASLQGMRQLTRE